MDEIRVTEGRTLDDGSCNRCTVEVMDGRPVYRDEKVKMVYFYGSCVRLCDEHYREMVATLVRLFVDGFLPEE